MSMSHTSGHASIPVPKAAALAVGLAVAFAGTAGAEQFKYDNGVTGSFDTTISAGISVRAEKQDLTLYGIANGGTSRSVNDDDGNLNYKKGAPFSELLKVTHDLELKQDSWGMFVRGLYFVDFKNRDNDKLYPATKNKLGHDVRILDAFVTKAFDLGGRSVRFRAGKQVISWGESTFIPNGINVVNPVDLSKLRVPGSELKEAFIPTLSVLGSFEISKAASFEVFGLFNHDKVKIEPRGAYFSNNDTVSEGSDRLILTFGRRNDIRLGGRPPGNPIPAATPGVGATAAALYGPFDPAFAVWVPRTPDHNASDEGQYGVAFRYLASELNNTEFGLYYMNYHSRTPLLSAIKGTATGVTTGGPFAAATGLTGTASYFAEYPENIRMYGVSFNTQGPMGIALQGEYSFRPNQPLQYASAEVILASLSGPNLLTGFTDAGIGLVGGTTGTKAATVPNGTLIKGWAPVKVSQFQMTGTKTFPSVMGSEQAAIVGEIGYTKYHGLPTGLKFAGPATNLPATELGALFAAPSAGYARQTDGYVTDNSWGYRLVGSLTYSNLVFGANVIPRLNFSHDVKGVSQTFNQGVMSYSLGTNFDWQKKLTLDLSFTSFYGGRSYCGTDTVASQQVLLGGQKQTYCSSANPLKDRDFYSVVVSYSF